MATPTAASANRVGLRYGDELYTTAGVAHDPAGSWGTVPSVNFDSMNFTGESLEHNKSTERSKNIRTDRQMSPAVQVATRAAGDTMHELNVGGEQPIFIGAALETTLAYVSTSNWQSIQTASGSATFATGPDTITLSGANFDTKFVVGQFIRVTGSVNNGTNAVPKFFSIKAVTSATVLTVNETLTAEGPVSVVISGTMARNGTTTRSFYIEKAFTDVANTFIRFPGAVINAWDLSFEAGQIVKSNFTWLAEKGDSATSSATMSSITAAATHNPLNATSNVSGIYEGGSALSSCILNAAIKVENGLRERPAVGRPGSCGIGEGACNVTGRLQAYFDGLTLYDKFEGHTGTSLRLVLQDSALGGYIITVPSLKYTTGRVVARSGNSDVILELEFAADIAGTSTGQIAPGCMIQVDRFAAV